MQQRVVMLVDLDYFYAQVEEIRNPSIRDKPVVVCVYSGRTEDSGAVATANYIAREHGVRSGIPIALAKKRLKGIEAVFLPMDRRYYEEVSERVMAILRGYADAFEQVGIDEAYLDVGERVRGNFKDARWAAFEIKDKTKAQEGITCSIGVAPNKLVAKIASDVQKPDGLTVVEADEVESFLSPMPVGRIPGIGAKTEGKMGELGISTISDLARFDAQKLIETFGKALGTYFHNASVGLDDQPVEERGEALSISRIATLKENTRDLSVIMEKANQLSAEVYSRLLERGLTFKSIGIVVVMTDLTAHSRSKTFENPMNQLEVIKKTARELFERFLAESTHEARRVGVKVSGFEKQEGQQRTLADFMQPSRKT
ncbi:MAG: DNA polymerase IV [Promethearchaeati archaeon SRVP18_Atabeyarchaeia-1]